MYCPATHDSFDQNGNWHSSSLEDVFLADMVQ